MFRAHAGKRSRQGRGGRRPKRRKPEDITVGSESTRESGTEDLVTPPAAVAPVDVGEVSARLSALGIDERARVPVETSLPNN